MSNNQNNKNDGDRGMANDHMPPGLKNYKQPDPPKPSKPDNSGGNKTK